MGLDLRVIGMDGQVAPLVESEAGSGMERLIVVAGTITPMAIVTLDGWARVVDLAIVWGIAVVGILNRMLGSMERHVFSFSLMLILGWLSIPIMFPLAQRAGTAAVVLIGIGGGALTGPWQMWHGVRAQNAVATSAACGYPIAVAGTATFIWLGWQGGGPGYP